MRRKRTEKVSFLREVLDSSQSSFYNPGNSTIFSSHRQDLQELQGKYSENHYRLENESTSKRSKDLDETSSSKIENFLYIKTKDNQNIPVNLSLVQKLKVSELKKSTFPFIVDDKNIRLIYRGRLLDENEIVESLEFHNGEFIHAFISDKIDPLERSITNQDNTSYVPNLRGFDRLKDFAVFQEDIIFKKVAFHSHYVFIAKNNETDFSSLVNREEEWFALNVENVAKEGWFIDYNFYKELDEEIKKKDKGIENFFYFVIIFLAFLTSVFGLPFVIVKKINNKIKEALIVGMIFKIIYICVFMIIFKEIRLII